MTIRRALVLGLLLSSLAQATECPAVMGAKGGTASRSGEERLAWLASRFDAEAEAVDRWTLVWGGGYGLLTVGQLGLMGAFPRADQPDWYWGAISTVVGVVFALIPLEATATAPSFRARASAATGENVCALVAEGERLLESGADQEAFGTAWFVHAANVLFNAGIGLVYWLGYDHLQTAIINTVIGIGLGEGTVFLQPTGLVSGWDEYRGLRAPVKVSWSLFPAGLGLGFALKF